jgi:hypothetical protein
LAGVAGGGADHEQRIAAASTTAVVSRSVKTHAYQSWYPAMITRFGAALNRFSRPETS